MKKILMMSVREIYAMLLIGSMMLFSLIYTSMALFEKSIERVGIATIQGSEITYTLSSGESDFNISGNSGTITVAAGESKFFDITITNPLNISTRYKVYYKFSNGVTILDVNVGISAQSTGAVTDVIHSGSSQIVSVGIENSSSQSATIEIGVQGGYSSNEVVLSSGLNEMGQLDELTLTNLILGENNANVTTTVPTFSAESTDKGLFVQQGDSTKSIDGLPTYYFKGNVTNNYVKFGTYQTTDGENTVGDPIIWRVVRINEDGSIRLISQNSISSPIQWNSWEVSNYINDDGADSIIKSSVETWYDNNIGNNSELDSKVVISSFCNDTSENYTAASTRLTATIPSPIFTCPAGAITASEKVGLLTADELVYSGAFYKSSNIDNPTYMLSGNNAFWTLTPFDGYEVFNFSGTTADAPTWPGAYMMHNKYSGESSTARAVINLSPDVVVTGGDGLSADTAYTIQ